jgi:hypothetical protein
MTRRVILVSSVLATLAGIMTAAMIFASSPRTLAATGLVCPGGAQLDVVEGQSYYRPHEGDHVAPLRFDCVAPDGSRAEASFALAFAFVLGVSILAHAAWMLVVFGRLARIARSRSAGSPRT